MFCNTWNRWFDTPNLVIVINQHFML